MTDLSIEPLGSGRDYASFFSAIDLSLLSPPAIIEQLAFTDVFSAIMRDFVSRDPLYSTLLESQPAPKLLEVVGYREHILRQAFNNRAQQLLLAYATGTNLDHLAAFYSVYRALIAPADTKSFPPTAAIYESDDSLRKRTQLAPEAFSCAGPAGAYLFHTYAASPGGVANAVVYNAASGLVKPGVVLVVLKIADGFVANDVVQAVRTRLFRDDIKPLTDTVQVQVATPANYKISGTLFVNGGPDAALLRLTARKSLYDYLALRNKIGTLIARSGIFAALTGPYVESIQLDLPVGDFLPGLTQYANLTDLTLLVKNTV
jgi:phage-related baseplate assembly protein